MHDLFKRIQVWQRSGDALAIRYSCLSNLSNGKFAVQSADFFRMPLNQKQLADFENQFVELFIETSPLERCDWFESLEDAIAAHNHDF